MSNKKSKGAVLRQIGAKASASLILVSACAPIMETIAYAEATTPTTKAAVSSSSVTSSLEELPQTIDSSSSAQEDTSGSESSTEQSSDEKPIESSTQPSTSTSQSSSTTNSTTKPSTSSSKPATSSSKPAPKPGSSSSSSTSKGKPASGKQGVVDGSVSYSKNQSTQEFINKIGKDASKIGDENGIYASVMIAQAILESASGNSSLAREPNYNLFGIKGAYKGQSVGMPTLEDDGSGSMFSITANFRKYPSYKESLEDYAILIKGGTNSANSLYKGAWKSETKSYREATAHLTGRYATDTRYNQKLNGLIETYDLQQFDNVKKVKKKVKVTRHRVSENDSLWDLSKKYGSTIKRIKELNKMDADSELKPGSTIVVKRTIYDENDEKKKDKATAKPDAKKEENLSAKEKEALAKERKIAKEKKEVVLLKARQVGQAFSNAVPSVLFESKTLKVAGKQVKTNKTHYVAKGETIKDIASKEGVSIEHLVEWNNLEDSILTEGQVLITDSPYNSLI